MTDAAVIGVPDERSGQLPKAFVVRAVGTPNTRTAAPLRMCRAEHTMGHRAAAASEGSKGLGGALTANEWASRAERAPLARADGAVRPRITG